MYPAAPAAPPVGGTVATAFSSGKGAAFHAVAAARSRERKERKQIVETKEENKRRKNIVYDGWVLFFMMKVGAPSTPFVRQRLFV